jgi:DNA-binding MarR family transcriptional regulator
MAATPGFLVWRLAMRWRTSVDRAVAPFGLTHAQYSVLASLYGMSRDGTQPNQRTLADHTGMEVIYVSKLLRALERDGLVTRDPDPSDSRAVRLALTPTGERVATGAIDVVHELLDALTAPLGGFDGDRTGVLVAMLDELLAVPLPTDRATTSTPGG